MDCEEVGIQDKGYKQSNSRNPEAYCEKSEQEQCISAEAEVKYKKRRGSERVDQVSATKKYVPSLTK